MWRASIFVVLAAVGPAAGSVFSGRVVEDHSGNPLPRTEIRIARPHSSEIVDELETDGQGRFQTPELPDAEYVLRFSKADYAAVEVTARAHSQMFLRLTRFGAIAGKIADRQGRPVEAQVVALSASDAIAGVADQNPAPGEYRIYDLPPGVYRVAILTSGRSGRFPGLYGLLLYPNNSAPREFTVAGGEDYTGADFNLPGGPGFRLSVTADDAQARPVTFTLVSAEHPGRQLAQQMVSAGRPFTVDNVVPGNYELLATALNPSAFGRTPITVVAANIDEARVPLDQVRSATFLLRAAESCGTEAIVELQAREAWIPNRPVSLPVSAGKPATAAALAPARYSVTAKAPGGNCYAAVAPDLDLTHDSASRPVEVVLSPPGSIQGHLTGAARPAEYAVVLTARDGSGERLAFPDESGAFAFADLPPGEYSVLAAGHDTRWRSGRPAALREISGGAPTVVEIQVSEVVR